MEYSVLERIQNDLFRALTHQGCAGDSLRSMDDLYRVCLVSCILVYGIHSHGNIRRQEKMNDHSIEILTRIKHQATEACLIALLKQILKREPSLEDGKRVTMAYTGERYSLGYLDWCVVLFDGVNIGRMFWETNNHEIKVTFQPNSSFK